MAEEVIGILNQTYQTVTAPIPEQYQILVNIAFYTIVIAVYSIIIWKFYKFLARRDIIKLNLTQYNRTERPVLSKFLASILFFIEYIIILPIIVIVWFSVLGVFLVVLSQEQTAEQILLISAAIVAATRITAYFSGTLSQDLAKMFPFTVLAFFLLKPDFFNLSRFVPRLSEIPSLFQHILIFIIFIIAIEFILRFLFTIVDLFTSGGESEEDRQKVKEVLVQE